MKAGDNFNSWVLNNSKPSGTSTGSAIAAQSVSAKMEDVKPNISIMAAQNLMFPCGQCDKQFLSKKSLWVHSQTQHPTNVTKTPTIKTEPQSSPSQDVKSATPSDERFRFIIESSTTRGQLAQQVKVETAAEDSSSAAESNRPATMRSVKPVNYSDAARKQNIRAALERREAALFKCPHCNRKYFTKRKLWFHKKKVHLGKAGINGMSSNQTSGSMQYVPKIRLTLPKPPQIMSIQQHHDINGASSSFAVPNIGAQFHCGQCNLSFYTESHLEDHVKERHSITESFSLPTVDVDFTSPHFEVRLNPPPAQDGGNPPLSVQKIVFNGHAYPCHVCGKEFDKQNSLLMHLLRVHKTGSNIRKGYRKPPGEKITYRRRRIVPPPTMAPSTAAYHVEDPMDDDEYEGEEDEAYPDEDPSGGSNQFYCCQICSKAFKTKETLRGHVKDYHTGRKYACDICGKCLSYQRNLAYHRRVYHQILN